MRNALAISTVIAALVLAGCEDRGIHRAIDFDVPVTDIHVLIDAGNIELVGTDEPFAHLKVAVTYHGSVEPELEAFVDGSLLRVWLRCGDGCWDMRGKVTVHAPKAVRGMLETGHGRIRLERTAGELAVENRTGQISGMELTCPRLVVRSDRGSAKLAFSDRPGLVDVATDHGDIDLEVPAGGYDIDADGDDVRLESVFVDPSSPDQLLLDTITGRIRINGS
jgi:hypothetical protein